MEQQSSDNSVLYANGSYYLPGIKAAITFKRKDLFATPQVPGVEIGAVKGKKYRKAITWTPDPVEVMALIGRNPVASAALEYKIELGYGMGVQYGHFERNNDNEKNFVEDFDNTQINDFFERNDINSLILEQLIDVNWFNNSFLELILDSESPDKRKIVEINHLEAVFSRLEEMNPDTGRIENHFYSAEWSTAHFDLNKITITPVLETKRPIQDMEERIGRKPLRHGKGKGDLKDEKKERYVLLSNIPTPGRTYYQRPTYYSIIESGWIDFANAIPEFKKSLMQNQITVKYHIEIHVDYFQGIFAKEGQKTVEEQAVRVKKEFKDINDFLSGVENTGKSWISYYRSEPTGSGKRDEVSMIKINVLDNKLKGGDYLDDSHEASSMTYTAFKVHPNVIGVIPGKTTSNLSGSDKRELERLAQAKLKPVRDRILRVLYLIKQINHWPPEVQFNIPDVILTTLDQGRETETIQ